MTSSQGHGIFIKAFPLFGNRSHWKRLARHLYGLDWNKFLKAPQEEETSGGEMTDNDEEAMNDNDEEENGE